MSAQQSTVTASSTLGGAVKAEFLKIFTTRMWWILAIIMVVYVGFTAAAIAAGFGFSMSTDGDSPMQPDGGASMALNLPPLVYSLATAVGYVFPVIVGTLAITGEHRHQTLTPTFLATPRRGRVLVAKMCTLFVVGALFGVVGLIGSAGIGGALLTLSGNDAAFGDTETWLLFARTILAMALWAVIGVGLGALIPNQIAAIVVLLAFTQFVEPIVRAAAMFVEWLAPIGKFLPGGAGDALVGSSLFSIMGTAASEPLSWWQGGLVLLAYAVVAGVLGYLVSWRKDVT